MRRTEIVETIATHAPSLVRGAIRCATAVAPSLHRHWLIDELAPIIYGTGYPVTVGGVSIRVNPSGRMYYVRGFEGEVRRQFAAAVRPGARVVDIGANAGYYSVMASELAGPTGLVFSIEPSPANLTLLRRNLRGRTNTKIRPVAASQKHERLQFSLSATGMQDALTEMLPDGDKIGSAQVEARALDDLIEPPVDVIKIDVQGVEVTALKGFDKTIRQSPGVRLFAEWSPACAMAAWDAPDALPRYLMATGWTITQVIPAKDTTIESLDEALRLVAREPNTTAYWDLIAHR